MTATIDIDRKPEAERHDGAAVRAGGAPVGLGPSVRVPDRAPDDLVAEHGDGGPARSPLARPRHVRVVTRSRRRAPGRLALALAACAAVALAFAPAADPPAGAGTGRAAAPAAAVAFEPAASAGARACGAARSVVSPSSVADCGPATPDGRASR